MAALGNLPRVDVYRLGTHGVTARLGYGTLMTARGVILHPRAAAAAKEAVAAATGPVRVRCQCDSPGAPVIDGTLEVAAQSAWQMLVAVDLDLTPDPQVGDANLPGKGYLEKDDYARALADFAGRQEASDPAVPAKPPSAAHGGSTHVDGPGIRPPWCWLFPHCAGCS